MSMIGSQNRMYRNEMVRLLRWEPEAPKILWTANSSLYSRQTLASTSLALGHSLNQDNQNI